VEVFVGGVDESDNLTRGGKRRVWRVTRDVGNVVIGRDIKSVIKAVRTTLTYIIF
jgi:hypothetical protein